MSFSDLRRKARDNMRNTTAIEYIKTLELYYSYNEGYPYDPTMGKASCLSDFTDNRCGWGNDVTENTNIVSSIRPYYPNPPGIITPNTHIALSSNDYEGPVYICLSDNGSVCLQYKLVWALEQDNVSCGADVETDPEFINTWCIFKSDPL